MHECFAYGVCACTVVLYAFECELGMTLCVVFMYVHVRRQHAWQGWFVYIVCVCMHACCLRVHASVCGYTSLYIMHLVYSVVLFFPSPNLPFSQLIHLPSNLN